MSSGRIVFASSSSGKIRELASLLEPMGFSVCPQEQFAIEAVEETAHTFVENALLKARHASNVAEMPAIADDSGLEVDALQGAPGLYSARYAERHKRGSGDAANNELLLEHLAAVEDAHRTARFRCVVVYLRHPYDPSPLIAQGTWEGHVLREPVGEFGFGYDPLFCNHDTQTSAGLLDKQTKNRLSHRGKAIRKLVELLGNAPSDSSVTDT